MDGERVEVRVYKNGGEGNKFVNVKVKKSKEKRFMEKLKSKVLKMLFDEKELADLIFHYRYFELRDNAGDIVETTSEMEEGKRLYVVPEGEHWVYPSNFPGEKIPHIDTIANKTLYIETVLSSPKLFKVENFLSKEEIGG